MVFSLIGRIAREHPFKFGCIFSCAKTSFSDWLVQSAIEKREKIDWKRNGTFAAFGLFYLGGVQYALYVPIFGRLFPTASSFAAAPLAAKLKDIPGQRRMLAQVFLDQFVHHPILYFPTFYALKEVVNGGSVTAGLEKYQGNYKEDLVALWKLWVPSTILNFTFMPMYLRIPWVATTSLAWTCILSYMRGSTELFETNPDLAEDAAGNQGRALKRAISMKPATDKAAMYDSDKAHLLLNVTGHDRVGYVSDIMRVVASRGGDVLDARLYKLGGQFIANMLVSAEHEVAAPLIADLTNMPDLQVGVQQTEPWRESEASPDKAHIYFEAHIHVTGPDRPGIIERVSTVCKDSNVDINHLQCALVSYPLSDGTPQKHCSIRGVVRSFQPVDVDNFRKLLREAERDLELKMRLTVDSEG